MSSADQINGLFGLAARAGKVIYGSETLLRAKAQKLKLVIIATDLNPTTITKLENYLRENNIPYSVYLTKTALGAILGKNEVGAFALTDAHLAKEIKKIMKAGE